MPPKNNLALSHNKFKLNINHHLRSLPFPLRLVLLLTKKRKAGSANSIYIQLVKTYLQQLLQYTYSLFSRINISEPKVILIRYF